MADLYKLLANPARLEILLVLSRTEQTWVSDLATVLGFSIAATSHQLKLLKDRGWLRGKGDGKLVYYSLASAGLKDALEGDLRLLSESSPCPACDGSYRAHQLADDFRDRLHYHFNIIENDETKR